MVDYTKAANYVTDSAGRRQFADRDVANGVPGTSLVEADQNMNRNELVYLVKTFGLTPDADDHTQVYQAIDQAMANLVSTVEDWGNGKFLALSSTALQTVTGPVTFSGIVLVPAVTDWTTYQPVGAKDADARYVKKSGDTMAGALIIASGGVLIKNAYYVGNGIWGGDLGTAGDIPWAPQFISKYNDDYKGQSLFCHRTLVGSYEFASIQVTDVDGGFHELQFRGDDRLYTASGNVFALVSELSAYQKAGDYATNSALNSGLAGKQPSGDYVIHSEFPCNLSGNGWQKLPSGLIIQWGQNTSGAGTYSFPTTFPNACFVVNPGNTDIQGSYVDNAFAYAVNNSQFYIATKASNTGTVTGFPASWFAIGH